jgi:hypothetical protein
MKYVNDAGTGITTDLQVLTNELEDRLTRIESHTAAHCDLTAVQAELARLVALVDFAQQPAIEIVGYEPSDAE